MHVVLEGVLTAACLFLLDLFYRSSQTAKPLLGYGLTAAQLDQKK